MTRSIFSFHGGVHVPGHKAESSTSPIARAPLPSLVIVPLSQHIGAHAKPVVKVGDRVLKGQLIGAPDGTVSCGVHAPTSGTVSAIDLAPIPHPSGLSDRCITITPDGADTWADLQPIDYLTLPASEVRDRLREAGIAGLGGAVFPTAVKLNPGKSGTVPTLIINGAECEPWITCDDLLMRERAPEIVTGIKIMQHLLGAHEVLIGIEDNKPEAIAAMRAATVDTGFEVIAVPTLYPMGGGQTTD